MNEAEYIKFVLRRHVRERQEQHRENLRLWKEGTLTPTEPDPEERIAVVRELKASLAELAILEEILKE